MEENEQTTAVADLHVVDGPATLNERAKQQIRARAMLPTARAVGWVEEARTRIADLKIEKTNLEAIRDAQVATIESGFDETRRGILQSIDRLQKEQERLSTILAGEQTNTAAQVERVQSKTAQEIGVIDKTVTSLETFIADMAKDVSPTPKVPPEPEIPY